MRDQLAGLISHHMGTFRFGKQYRWGISRLHRCVYRCINTPLANILADEYQATRRQHLVRQHPLGLMAASQSSLFHQEVQPFTVHSEDRP